MPASFIPVWMSIGEAESFRSLLQEMADDPMAEFPEREFDLIDTALQEEPPRSYEEMVAEHGVVFVRPVLDSVFEEADDANT